MGKRGRIFAPVGPGFKPKTPPVWHGDGEAAMSQKNQCGWVSATSNVTFVAGTAEQQGGLARWQGTSVEDSVRAQSLVEKSKKTAEPTGEFRT